MVLPMDHFRVGTRFCQLYSVSLAWSWIRNSSTFSVLRPFPDLRPFIYFELCTSARVLWTLYFDSRILTLLQIWSSYCSRSIGRSTVLVELKLCPKGRTKIVTKRSKSSLGRSIAEVMRTLGPYSLPCGILKIKFGNFYSLMQSCPGPKWQILLKITIARNHQKIIPIKWQLWHLVGGVAKLFCANRCHKIKRDIKYIKHNNIIILIGYF